MGWLQTPYKITLHSHVPVLTLWMMQVQEVVLVEVKDAHVQHAANVRIILEQIAPSALLTVLTVELSKSAPNI